MNAGKIYGLWCPIKKDYVYVGKTVGSLLQRLSQHRASYTKAIQQWFESVKEANLYDKIKIVLLEDNIMVEELNERETFWISKYSHLKLFNSRPSIVKSKQPTNAGLQAKVIHLSDDVIGKLIVKGFKKKPRLTAKQYIQELATKEANR